MPSTSQVGLSSTSTPWSPTYRIFDPFCSPEDVSSYKSTYPDLKVIGATPPRTGTSSLKVALEILGLGPVDHMQSCLRDSGRSKEFIRAYSDPWNYDYRKLFAGYQSAVDEPVASMVPYVMKFYPDAKIIVTKRDSKKWWKSTDDTIGFFAWRHATLWKFTTWWFPKIYWQGQLAVATWHAAIAQNRLAWGAGPSAMDSYVSYIESLNIPPERCLWYSVEQGWGPLCEFLGVEVPDVEFPRVNDSEAFKWGMKVVMMQGMAIWTAVAGLVGYGGYQVIKQREHIIKAIEGIKDQL